MEANPDKYNLLVITNALKWVNINEFSIIKDTEEKLLGINFDNKFCIENNISSLCKKANQKLQKLARIFDYINLSK